MRPLRSEFLALVPRCLPSTKFRPGPDSRSRAKSAARISRQKLSSLSQPQLHCSRIRALHAHAELTRYIPGRPMRINPAKERVLARGPAVIISNALDSEQLRPRCDGLVSSGENCLKRPRRCAWIEQSEGFLLAITPWLHRPIRRMRPWAHAIDLRAIAGAGRAISIHAAPGTSPLSVRNLVLQVPQRGPTKYCFAALRPASRIAVGFWQSGQITGTLTFPPAANIASPDRNRTSTRPRRPLD